MRVSANDRFAPIPAVETSCLRRQIRWPMINRFDVEACGCRKGLRDDIQFILRNHVFGPGKSVRRPLFGELHRGLGSKIPISQDDVVHRRPAVGVVTGERSGGFLRFDQCWGEGAGIKNALRAALAADRLHRMCRIAQQCYAAERPSRDRIAIDQWEFIDVGRSFDQRWQVEPGKSPSAESGKTLFLLDLPVPVLTRRRLIRHRHLADPVGQQFAARGFTNGIDDDALMEVTCNHHGLAIEEGIGFDRRTPQDLLREARLAFSRIKLMAHDGMDAVGPNENIGLVGQFGPGISINEASHDLVAPLLEARKPQPASEVFGSNAVADGANQEDLQLSAVDRNLRPPVSSGDSPWLAVDELSELVAEVEALRSDARHRKHVAKSKLGQLADRGRLQVNAHTERRRIAHRLIDPDRYSSLMQAERKTQPTDAATGDNDLQLLHFAATPGSRTLPKVSNSILRSSP